MTYQPPIVPGQQPNPYLPAAAPPPKKRGHPLLIAAGAVGLVLVVVLGIGLALGQDGGSPSAKKPSAWEQEQAQVANTKPGSVKYATAVQLVGALNRAGTACGGWEAVSDPIGAQERGSCHVGSEEVTTAIFTTSAAAEAEPQEKAELLAGISDVHMVVGPNWTLGCDSAGLCKTIADKFGGKMVTIPSGTAATTPAPEPTTAKPAKVTYAKLTDRQWKKIAKNPDAYVAKSYVVYGVVTQFDSATGDDTFRANVAARNLAEAYDYDTNTLLRGEADQLADLVEDDEFRAKVTVFGAYDYDTQIGGSTTVPFLLVDSIDVL